MSMKHRLTVAHLEASEMQGHPANYRNGYLISQAKGVGFEEYLAEDGMSYYTDLADFLKDLFEGAEVEEPDYDTEPGHCVVTMVYPIGDIKQVKLRRSTVDDVLSAGAGDPDSVAGFVSMVQLTSDLSREQLLEMDYADWLRLQQALMGFTKPDSGGA